ncbi:polysaccharide lyase 6 family protein [Verrucomicrobium sp. BvORR106]|uniref:polysaccharide lyase 6 family protein n=1 Tax=Verrucomicrobium sp. BvORR106 TaxID=1403819 RepID=UPI00056F2053|nr:polysaccharide lyase 6 family protein [Verrucomicrobium sp. BvORR106]
MRALFLLCLLIACSAHSPRAHAEEPTSLSLAPHFRSPQPGTPIELPDGTYNTKAFRTLTGLRGTPDQPIHIRAAHRGKVIITGDAGLILRDCEHVILEGLIFENDADQQCVQLDNCRHVRITRNVFRPKERAKPRHWEHWVTVDGARSADNRIDHNLFERKVNRGSPLFIRGDDAALVCSQRDRVDHNHFRDVIYANRENGHETIRTGGNDLGAAGKSSFTIIEHNLLERCSGEDEIISIKSSDNVIRNNTLIDCRGAVCMRLGNRNEVSGNVIIATQDGPGFGGIKLFGFEHRVTGNYFQGLTGTKHEAPFALTPGMMDAPSTENIRDKYDDMTAAAPTRCHIADNTWIDCSPLQFGYEKGKEDKKWPLSPNGCVFVNNRVLRIQAQVKAMPLIILGTVRDLQARENVLYDAGATYSGNWHENWGTWVTELPEVKVPKRLTEADVGPAARETQD